VSGDREKAVAFLHDVAEKAPGWTPERLKEVGFSSEVVKAVELLTLQPGETKDALVIRAASTPLSLAVKRADLKDNLAQMKNMGRSGDVYLRGLHLLSEASSVLPPQRRAGFQRQKDQGSSTGQPMGTSCTAKAKPVKTTGGRLNGAVRAVLAVIAILFVGGCALGVWLLYT
jgi:hypothetical protein